MNNKLPYIMLGVLGVTVVFALWLFSAMVQQHFRQHKKEDVKTQYAFEEQKETYSGTTEGTPVENEAVKLTVNPLEDYNQLSKDEIYRIRKKYVSKSLFATEDYEPRGPVFGQIESGKYWWGLNQFICDQGEDTASGLSAMSRFINNPNLLISPFFPFSYEKTPQMDWYCNSDFAKFIPYELTYDKSKNLITAKYKSGEIAIKNKHNLILTGMNARDFGYDFVYISGLSGIQMKQEFNSSEHIYQLRDFVHNGSSCKMPGGCNNISPRQTELEFYIITLPASMDIKLWKNKPLTSIVGADINYRIIFTGI